MDSSFECSTLDNYNPLDTKTSLNKGERLSVKLSRNKEMNCIASGEAGRISLLNTDKRLNIMRKKRKKFEVRLWSSGNED